jgi:hypothetical protein
MSNKTFEYRLGLLPPDVSELECMLVYKQCLHFYTRAVPLEATLKPHSYPQGRLELNCQMNADILFHYWCYRAIGALSCCAMLSSLIE